MLRLGEHVYPPERALVMAIINRTPDSFYDGGANMADDDALSAVDRAVLEGADILDIGGVKAGPGQIVDEAEESAPDEADQEVFLRRPVQVDGALSDVRTLCDIGNGEPLGAATDQKIVGRLEQPRGLGRMHFRQIT